MYLINRPLIQSLILTMKFHALIFKFIDFSLNMINLKSRSLLHR